MKLLRFTAPAERVMVERDLDRSWIEAAIREPDWRDHDPRNVSVSRFFKQILEREGRVLRVPCVETVRNPYTVGLPGSWCETIAMTFKLEYDAETDDAYIRFSQEAIKESEEVSAGIVLDFDSNGRIVGMEIMKARQHLPPDLLPQAA